VINPQVETFSPPRQSEECKFLFLISFLKKGFANKLPGGVSVRWCERSLAGVSADGCL
jgi:hypothetical protein